MSHAPEPKSYSPTIALAAELRRERPDIPLVRQLHDQGAVLPDDAAQGFCNAAVANNRRMLNAYLAAGLRPGEISTGAEAFHWIASFQHYDLVQDCIDAGININDRGTCGNTVLQEALHRGDVTLMKLLIAAGADVNMINNNGDAALHWAVWTGQAEAVGLLLGAGARADNRALGKTCLQWAAGPGCKDNADIIMLLITSGADLNLQDADGNTALHKAAMNNKRPLLRLLVDAGARLDIVNHRKQTVIDTMRPSVYDAKDDQDIVWLTRYSHDTLARAYALSGGADRLRICLFHAVEKGYPALAKTLIENGAPLDMRDDLGLGLLHRAALARDEGMVALLLNAGAPLHMRMPSGATALDMARLTPADKCCALLERATADDTRKSCAAGMPVGTTVTLRTAPRLKR